MSKTGPQRVALSYHLVDQAQAGDRIQHPLFQMLDAVERRGSISSAARVLNLSYRFVWGELKRWEAEFGRLLIVWERGQKARLTEFGQKLLWAERHAQSRLAPQIQALRAELERAFGLAFDDAAHVLPVSASHDDALALFQQHAQNERLFLDIRFKGSIDALSALAEGRASVAGFHLPVRDGVEPAIRQRLVEDYAQVASGSRATCMPFARRQQGLMVEPGNPLGIKGLADVANTRCRFVNRSMGAGTRLFLDAWMLHHRVKKDDLKGYAYEEPSHAAVAEAVRTGAADVGLGLASVALSRGLGFVPLYQEDYFLAMAYDGLNDSALNQLQQLLTAPQWTEQLEQLSGYTQPPLADGLPALQAMLDH